MDNTSLITGLKISSLAELSTELINLKRSASLSVQEVIEGQLFLIQFIQAPILVDKSIDTLILHLKMALSTAQTEFEKENIRIQFALLIQSLTLYLKLKSDYDIEGWKKTQVSLLDSVVSIIQNCFQRVMSFVKGTMSVAVDLAISSGTIALGSNELMSGVAQNIRNILQSQRPQPEKKTGLFARYRQNREARRMIEAIKEEYEENIFAIVEKLLKYRKIIGPSIIITGIVEPEIEKYGNHVKKGYASELDWLHLKHNSSVYDSRNDKFRYNWDEWVNENWDEWVYRERKKNSLIVAAAVPVVSLSIALVRLIFNISITSGWFGYQMLYTLVLLIGGLTIFFFYLSIKVYSKFKEDRRKFLQAKKELDDEWQGKFLRYEQMKQDAAYFNDLQP